MTINAKDLLDRARRIIQDETSVRWPLAELRFWLNDSLRELALYRPQAFSSSFPFALQVGTYQVIPDSYSQLIRVPRNLKSLAESPRLPGPTIRTVDGDLLSAQSRDWNDPSITPASAIVRNVVFDISNPQAFWVYPPNDGTGVAEIIAVKVPVGIASPSDPENITLYDIDLDVIDIFGNAIVDYILYRAYSKDSQFSGSAQRAIACYQAFGNAIGVNIQNANSINPNTETAGGNRA